MISNCDTDDDYIGVHGNVEQICVQEYERAVIFRLGRLLTGGARGPGEIFSLLIGFLLLYQMMLGDNYLFQKVSLRDHP